MGGSVLSNHWHTSPISWKCMIYYYFLSIVSSRLFGVKLGTHGGQVKYQNNQL